MKKKLTYKKKNYLILIIALVFGIISYHLAIKKTIALYQLNNNIEERLAKVKNAPQLIRKYKKDLTQLNDQLGYVGSSNMLSQDKILEVIDRFCKENNAYLKSYPQTILNRENAYTLETNVIEVSGQFTDIVRLIYQLEYVQNVSKVNSTVFKKERDIKTRKYTLTATIFLQNIN